ncbi:fatty acyl-CoA reductase wat-like [Spodoptera litura]|uniref:Fatty acyl-CoA reductase n=1 Tax=Spodoptera litura TaxID=69820 RepID=A0A9J7E435_SPOLT|nr:fatty acyl-CoA reductase wat-like [Spodoptera litura]XP_022823968.1 fatty acyl-CoA reductase wat-like [Spodoptera litura]
MDPALAVELEALSRQKAMFEATERGDSTVQQFYKDSTVFLTGASGFLGKQLVEKLFRACNIRKIFILLRPKKNMTIQERLEEMLQDPVFGLVKKKKPDFAENIVPVKGDVAETKLGLSDKDWTMITSEVDVIFHVAATTRFDEALRVSTMINIRGTRETVLLGKDCQKLKSFVYVSTTYSTATQANVDKEVMERFYPCPLPPELMIDMAENIDDERMEAIEANLIKGYPNTYTFTKSIAEEVVRSLAGEMPTCIIRPAVVISSYREPVPGWADASCAFGASGLILGPATGLIHAIYASNDVKFSLVPVDYVNNAILVAGWHTATEKPNDVQIYSVSSARNLFHWEPISSKIRDIGKVLPTPLAVWYTFIINTSNKPLFFILTWLLHYIPGYILDAGCILLGKPTMFIKLYNRVNRSSLALSYFTTHTWVFNDSNTDKLFNSLSKTDRLIFNFDTSDINISEFVTLWCVGLRKYLMKDGIKNTEYARKKQFLLKYLHYVVSCMYVYVLFKITCLVCYLILCLFGFV